MKENKNEEQMRFSSIDERKDNVSDSENEEKNKSAQSSDGNNAEALAEKRRKGKTKKSEKTDQEPLAPLKTAADRIARLLCEISSDSTLFVCDAHSSPEKRLDTKALKEFSGVLKEMSAVMTELHGQENNKNSVGVRIEFSDEALELGS